MAHRKMFHAAPGFRSIYSLGGTTRNRSSFHEEQPFLQVGRLTKTDHMEVSMSLCCYKRTLLRSLVKIIQLALICLLLSCSPDCTRFASNYEEEAFSRIEPGMRRHEVLALLGPELHRDEDALPETWIYEDAADAENYRMFEPLDSVTFSEDGLSNGLSGRLADLSGYGQTREKIRETLGEPSRIVPARASILWYSEPGRNGKYRARGLALDGQGLVVEKIAYDTWD